MHNACHFLVGGECAVAVPTLVELGDGEAAEVQNPIRKSLQSRLSSMGKVRSSFFRGRACMSKLQCSRRESPLARSVCCLWCSTCKTVLRGKSSGPAAKALLPVLNAVTFSHVILHNFAYQWVSVCVDRGQDIEIPDLHVSRLCVFDLSTYIIIFLIFPSASTSSCSTVPRLYDQDFGPSQPSTSSGFEAQARFRLWQPC
jgi:hypothetical protein